MRITAAIDVKCKQKQQWQDKDLIQSTGVFFLLLQESYMLLEPFIIRYFCFYHNQLNTTLDTVAVFVS